MNAVYFEKFVTHLEFICNFQIVKKVFNKLFADDHYLKIV